MSAYVIKAVLSNAQHPEYGQATIPFPIPNGEYDQTIETLEALKFGGHPPAGLPGGRAGQPLQRPEQAGGQKRQPGRAGLPGQTSGQLR